MIILKARPVPATGPVNLLVQGITKKSIIQVIDLSGKMVQQISVTDNMPQTISLLQPGIYFIQLVENKDVVQKIIIQ